MAYQMNVYSALCALSLFDINGIAASSSDFGEQGDRDPFNAEPYCCGDMRFERFVEPQAGVLERYNITREEYDSICDELEDVLSFGSCGWCS
jgi:hypothetical protein